MRDSREGSRPPDGGWGWVVVCGSALSHVFLIPILQNFTLIFKDRFSELNFTSTDITTLVSLNASFGMILGLLNGPLLKIFGYRKLAFVGLTLYEIGLLCTGVADSYVEFIVFYGLLSSLGMVMVMASFSLAINSYFLKNRSKAIGYFMSLTGLGPIALPFVISYLLSSYGLKWTVFLLSGLNLHAFIGVSMLQPVKWHAKLENCNLNHEDRPNNVLLSDIHSYLDIAIWESKMSLPNYFSDSSVKSRKTPSEELSHMRSKEVIFNQCLEKQMESCMPLKQEKRDKKNSRKLSLTFLDNEDYKNMMNSTLHMIEGLEIREKTLKFASAETLSFENEDHKDNVCEKTLLEPLEPTCKTNENLVDEQKSSRPVGLILKFVHFLRDIYDLDLFRDPLYVNILLGLSLAFAGEVIFSTMTPIILKEAGFNTEDTAIFMSVIAGCDLLCRFLAPFVGKKLKLNSKKMYLVALLMLLLSRTSIHLASSFESYLVVSMALGVGKGVRSVFWVLVLPDYVPLTKLPSASAFQSLINGVLILVSGPLIGAITALTRSYFNIITASNILTLTTIILWSGEIIYFKLKKKNTKNENSLIL